MDSTRGKFGGEFVCFVTSTCRFIALFFKVFTLQAKFHDVTTMQDAKTFLFNPQIFVFCP